MTHLHSTLRDIQTLRKAANDRDPVGGLTHRYYKYPARFSPRFVQAALETFSKPGDVVLDPYMGGGTSIVEAMARGRRAVGCDINALAVFVTRVKTTTLTSTEKVAVIHWATNVIPELSYHDATQNLDEILCLVRTRNLAMPKARALKKVIALALLSLEGLPTRKSKDFARCALLNVSQWALNGKRDPVSAEHFRVRITTQTLEMIRSSEHYASEVKTSKLRSGPVLIHGSCEVLNGKRFFAQGARADLVVTSPPYPGVHVLYHRWQVDGRKETPAPYWIADCLDGQGPSFYNFGSRAQSGLDDYFRMSLKTLQGIRAVMKEGAPMIQMLAFSDPRSQLPRYLENMCRAGFEEMRPEGEKLRRIWRHVPGRSWHAELKGNTHSSREVVLLHRAT